MNPIPKKKLLKPQVEEDDLDETKSRIDGLQVVETVMPSRFSIPSSVSTASLYGKYLRSFYSPQLVYQSTTGTTSFSSGVLSLNLYSLIVGSPFFSFMSSGPTNGLWFYMRVTKIIFSYLPINGTASNVYPFALAYEDSISSGVTSNGSAGWLASGNGVVITPSQSMDSFVVPAFNDLAIGTQTVYTNGLYVVQYAKTNFNSIPGVVMINTYAATSPFVSTPTCIGTATIQIDVEFYNPVY